ncbi:MAG: helix-turn-helix domain-containing protein [Firmicutes bacterium]|nr:helix-turn-helix domain-containing protein [Bacillota bacterium]
MFAIGDFIKLRRKDLGLTQAELCGDVLALGTLQRIEANKQLPNKFTFEYLVDRLGLSSDQYCYLLSGEDKEIYDLRYAFETLYNRGDYKGATNILEDLKIVPNLDGWHQNFISIAETLLLLPNGNISNETKLIELQKTVSLFINDFSPKKIKKALLMKKELVTLIALAVANYKVDNKETSLNVLLELINYINNNIADRHHIALVNAKIFLCLSAYYLDEENYSKALHYCNEGIETCIGNDLGMFCCTKLSFNKAKCLYSQNQNEKALACLKQAYYLAVTLGEKALSVVDKVEQYATKQNIKL